MVGSSTLTVAIAASRTSYEVTVRQKKVKGGELVQDLNKVVLTARNGAAHCSCGDRSSRVAGARQTSFPGQLGTHWSR